VAAVAPTATSKLTCMQAYVDRLGGMPPELTSRSAHCCVRHSRILLASLSQCLPCSQCAHIVFVGSSCSPHATALATLASRSPLSHHTSRMHNVSHYAHPNMSTCAGGVPPPPFRGEGGSEEAHSELVSLVDRCLTELDVSFGLLANWLGKLLCWHDTATLPYLS